MYKAKGDLFNGLIRRWTDSPYSHCELVVNGMCYSSSIRDGGVRCKEFVNSPNWDLFDLPWVDEYKVTKYYFDTFGTKYGWSDLINRHIFKLPISNGSGQFCSEWCADALQIPNARDYSPQTLYDLVKFINSKLLIAQKKA
jgi:hypothetical protein